jgi:hypothetical protein
MPPIKSIGSKIRVRGSASLFCAILRTSIVRSSTRARVFGPRLTGVANRIPAGSHLHDQAESSAPALQSFSEFFEQVARRSRRNLCDTEMMLLCHGMDL